MVSTAVAAKRRQKRKKKRISKHILASRERSNNNNETTTTIGEEGEEESNIPTTTTTKHQQHEKDPSEASNYLIMWKQREHGGWKFNKNTQSWLIRHMYEAEKVTKTTFSILMEYFVDLKGNTRDRVKEDATRRALRYKQWETSGNNQKQEKTSDADDDKQSEIKKDENDETNEEAKKWSELSDHDKRKEYKRARKVLETLK